MSLILLRHARLHGQNASALEPAGWVLIERAHIVDLGRGDPPCRADRIIDLQGGLLAPGLIDLHAHGALGVDTMDASPEALQRMARFYASHGVTSFLATTMTAPFDQILMALRNIAQVMATGTEGATLLGAHVEGPYLDAERRGCQDPTYVHRASIDEYPLLFETGAVRLITIAPEFRENEPLIHYAIAQGAAVAVGHSRASYEEICRAVDLGATQVTHLFNGMDPLHHRAPGLVGAALTLAPLYCQLIADNVHIHPAVLALAVRAKGLERTLLVTDAMSATGMADGDYILGNIAVTVRDGVSRTPEGVLAGSTLTMERAVINIASATGLSFDAAWMMGSMIPARALGIADHKGAIAVGMDADLVALDADHTVCLTMVEGRIVYHR